MGFGQAGQAQTLRKAQRSLKKKERIFNDADEKYAFWLYQYRRENDTDMKCFDAFIRSFIGAGINSNDVLNAIERVLRNPPDGTARFRTEIRNLLPKYDSPKSD